MTTARAGVAAGPLLRDAVARLAAAGFPTARQDAEWLLAAVLGVERFEVYLAPRHDIAPAAVERYESLVDRRAAHEPLQYLLGFEEFRGLRLAVTPDVLIPRPETEGLVGWAVEILSNRPAPAAASVVADVGTGSGAIACALAAALPDARVLAMDRSLAALGVASGNVRRLGFSSRVWLLAGDLLEPLRPGAGIDMVVANPPYLPSAIFPALPREVAGFEPRVALDGGPDGLKVIRRIVAGAPAVLQPGGWLLMEIGEDQAGRLASLMAAEGFSDIAARRDLASVERYIVGRLPGGTTLPAARRSSC